MYIDQSSGDKWLRPGFSALLKATKNGEILSWNVKRLDRISGNRCALSLVIRYLAQAGILFGSWQDGIITGAIDEHAIERHLDLVQYWSLGAYAYEPVPVSLESLIRISEPNKATGG
jgi:DNA invertase Pin-like site-specific DNA recombinase